MPPEREPSTMLEPAPEGEEHEPSPSRISVYAVEETPPALHGGLSSGTPEKTTYFRWEGVLHPTEAERVRPSSREGYVSSSNAQKKIETLAVNFAANYRMRQNPDLQARGEASYTFEFQPPREPDRISELQRDVGRGSTLRGLTPEEQE